MDVKPRDRRYRILWVSPELVLALVPPQRRLHADGTLDAFTLEGVPADARAVAVFYSEGRDAFAFQLHHPSFDPVPEGQSIPDVTATVRVECLRVARPSPSAQATP